MIIKKFQGKNEEEAKLQAIKELGSSVVIMNSRTIKKTGLFSFFRAPIVEITAAIEEESDNPPAPKADKPILKPVSRSINLASFPDVIPDDETPAPAKGSVGNSDIGAKLESLHSLIEEKLSRDESEKEDDSTVSSHDEKPDEMVQFLKLVYSTLMDNEIDEKYANELMGELEQMRRPGATMDYILSNIYQRMILKFGQASRILPAQNGPAVVYFMGPTGVGKTTTIAKIASDFSVNQKKKVALVTTDTYRIAATEQLKTYAGILGVPFEVVYQKEEMEKAYDKFKDFDYVLVDTAGHSPRNSSLKDSTKQFLHALDSKADKQVYLVLSATTKYKDLIQIADTYKELDDYRLVFTKLDETSCLGNLWNIRQYTGAAIGYVTTGQDVPDDIAVFNPQTTVKQLLGGSRSDS